MFFASYTGREPLYMYLLALAFAGAGSTAFALRLTSAAIGILTVALVFALGRTLLGRRVGVVASALLAVSYWHVTVSRNGYPNILIPPIEMASFFFLWRAWQRGRTRDWVVGGALAGLVLYTYLAARFWPVFLFGYFLLAALVAPARWRGRAGGLVVAALACLVVFAPLGIHFLRVPADFVQRADQVLLWREFQGPDLARAFLDNAWRTAQGLVVPGHGDGRWHFNLPGRSVFQPLAAVALVLGASFSLMRVVRPGQGNVEHRADTRLRYLAPLLWVAVLALPGTLTAELQPAGQRIFGTIPGLVILAGLGVTLLAKWVAMGWDRIGASRAPRAADLRGDRREPALAVRSQLARIGGGTVAVAVVTLAFLADLRSTVADYFGHWGTHPETYNIFNSDYTYMAAGGAADVAAGKQVVLLSRHYKHPTVAFLSPTLVDGATWAEPLLALPIPAAPDAPPVPSSSSPGAPTPFTSSPPDVRSLPDVRDTVVYYLPDSYYDADAPSTRWLEAAANSVTWEGPDHDSRGNLPGVRRYEVPRAAIGSAGAGSAAPERQVDDSAAAVGSDGPDAGTVDDGPVFNGEVAIVGATNFLTAKRGSEITVPVEWRVVGLPSSGRGFALHLRDAQGLTWAQADVTGYLSEQWRIGDWVLAWFPLQLDERMPPGEYDALLTLVDESGTPFGWHAEGAAGTGPPPASDAADATGVASASGTNRNGAASGVDVLVGRVTVARERTERPRQSQQDDATTIGTLPGGLVARTADLPGSPVVPGARFEVAIEWARESPDGAAPANRPPESFTFVAIGPDGARHELGGAEFSSGFPPWEWPDGEVLLGRYSLRLPGGPSLDGASLVAAAAGGEVELGKLQVAELARSFKPPPMSHSSDVEFGTGLRLIGYDIASDGPEMVVVTLIWRADSPQPAGKVFVHLHRGGAPVAQHDSEPADGTRPFPSLAPGEIVSDRHVIRLPEAESSDDLRVGVGVYDQETGVRWPFVGGESMGDRLELGTQLSPPRGVRRPS